MKKFMSIVLLVILSCTCFAGCGKENEKNIGLEISDNEQFSIGFVLGVNESFPSPFKSSATTEAMYNCILKCALNYGDITYTISEGDITQTKSIQINQPDKALSPSKLKAYAKETANQICQEMAKSRATSEENDPLEAIKITAAGMNTATNKKYLFICESGVCTTGLISQLEFDYISSDPKTVVDKLAANHSLPDLTGFEIYWIGMNTFSKGRQKMPDLYCYNNEALWLEILQRSGAETIFIDPTPVIGDAESGLPNVTPVNFPVENINDIETQIKNNVDVFQYNVKFIGDSAEYIDREQASNDIKSMKKYLLAHPETTILIAGTTARFGDGDGVALSLQRAETVKADLVDGGVNSDQVECIGLGSTDNCLRKEDHYSDGSFNEKIGARNRAIYFVIDGSATAELLKK